MRYYSGGQSAVDLFADYQNASAFVREGKYARRQSHHTEFTGYRSKFDFFEDRGGAEAPTRKPEASSTESAPTQSVGRPSRQAAVDYTASESVEATRIARDRVLLLAAKYAKGENQSEVVARLEILNSRLLERAPRVSQDQVQALEAAEVQVLEARTKREAMMRRLGLA